MNYLNNTIKVVKSLYPITVIFPSDANLTSVRDVIE